MGLIRIRIDSTDSE